MTPVLASDITRKLFAALSLPQTIQFFVAAGRYSASIAVLVRKLLATEVNEKSGQDIVTLAPVLTKENTVVLVLAPDQVSVVSSAPYILSSVTGGPLEFGK